MARTPNFVLQYLTEVEEKAEDVLTDKQKIVDLDKKRNLNREAIRAIKTKFTPSDSRPWLNFGGMFIKVDSDTAINMLETDQTSLSDEINQLRNDLHKKVNDLRETEGLSDLKGFDLASLDNKEVAGLRKARVL